MQWAWRRARPFGNIQAYPEAVRQQGFYQVNVARAVPLALTVIALVFEMAAWLT